MAKDQLLLYIIVSVLVSGVRGGAGRQGTAWQDHTDWVQHADRWLFLTAALRTACVMTCTPVMAPRPRTWRWRCTCPAQCRTDTRNKVVAIFAAWRGLAQRPPKACPCLAALVAALAWITPFASDNVNYAKHRWGLGIRDQGLGIDARPYPAGAGFGFWAPGKVQAAVHGTDRDSTRATTSHRFHEDLRSYLHPASHPAAPHPSVAPCTTGLP